jgi:hypothetical protein
MTRTLAWTSQGFSGLVGAQQLHAAASADAINKYIGTWPSMSGSGFFEPL